MHHLLSFLCHVLVAAYLASASPYASPELYQNRSNNSSQPPPSVIATTILSPNDTDLTLSFRILLYYNPPFSNNNSNPLNLSNRQTSTSRRPIDFCQSPTASFLTSYCRYSRGHYSALQDYMVFCQEDLPPRQHQEPSTTGSSTTPSSSSSSPAFYQFQHHHHLLPQMTTEYGACQQNEICVDGELGEGMAYCVNKSEFELLKQLVEESDPEENGENGSSSSRKGRRRKGGGDGGWITVGRKGGLRRKAAQMVISGVEGVMPMEVGGLNLKGGVWRDGPRSVDNGGDVVVKQERRCEGCFELRTGRLEDETNFLETQAKIMTGGTVAAAAAGVVWLMVSG